MIGTAVNELPAPVEEYLNWLAVERGRSVNTLAAYRRDLRAYDEFLTMRETPVERVREGLLHDYVAFLRASGKAPASVARAMVVVRTLHQFLLDEGLVGADPSADVAVPRVPSGIPKALTEAEVGRLLDAVVGHDAVARRDRSILELLYGTGMRISELCGLSLADLDLNESIAKVFGKGAKERIVPVGRLARQALGQWLCNDGRSTMVPGRWARRGDAEAVFLNQRGGRLSRQGAWMVVHRHAQTVGLAERLSPHVLRHSCATHMLDHGADIRTVQELLGHASLATTQVYTKVTADRLRSAYELAHPRAAISRAATVT